MRMALTAAASLLAALASTGLAAPPAQATLACKPTGVGGTLVEGARLDVFDSLAQLLPTTPQQGAAKVSLCQAGNAYESAQLEVTAGAAPAKVTAIEVSDLKGPGTEKIAKANMQLYREAYVTLTTMSDGELKKQVPRNAKTGQCTAHCEFPDPLIPMSDPLFHETRKGLPIEVPAGQDRAVWIDVFVPKGQAPGLYTGTLTLETQSKERATVEIAIQVVNWSMPSTSASPSHSAFTLDLGLRGPSGGSITLEQYAQYAELGLNNRLTIVPASTLGEAVEGELSTYLKPLFEGTDTHTVLSGAELTDYVLGTGFQKDHVAKYKSLFESMKATGKVSAYCDEIAPEACATALGAGDLAEWPSLPVLVTGRPPGEGWEDPKAHESEPELIVPKTSANGVNLRTATRGIADVVQLLEPFENGFYTSPGSRVPALTAWRNLKPGRQIWAYTSCASGGCKEFGEVTAKYSALTKYNGWPSYGIDQVSTEQRAVGWQMFINELDGEEYYSVDSNKEIWERPYGEIGNEYGMNGDGTLFYPWQGHEATIGGVKPIPVESIRLKRIRDGHEDFELLGRAAALAGEGAGQPCERPRSAATCKVLATAKLRFPNFYKSGPSATSFDGTRRAIIEKIK